MCLPDKGTMTIDAEIQLTVQLVQNSHQNHRKIQAQCSIIKIHASFQDLAVEEVRVKEEKSAISIWKWKKRTSGSARDTGRALALSGISDHMTSLPRRRPNCPQKKSPRRVRQEQTRTDNLVSESFIYNPQVSCFLHLLLKNDN